MSWEKRETAGPHLDIHFNETRTQSIISNAKFLATAQSTQMFAYHRPECLQTSSRCCCPHSGLLPSLADAFSSVHGCLDSNSHHRKECGYFCPISAYIREKRLTVEPEPWKQHRRMVNECRWSPWSFTVGSFVCLWTKIRGGSGLPGPQQQQAWLSPSVSLSIQFSCLCWASTPQILIPTLFIVYCTDTINYTIIYSC